MLYSAEDHHWARSRFQKNWEQHAPAPTYVLEVRSALNDQGSIRIGELFLTGSVTGTLTARLSNPHEGVVL